MEAKYNGSRFSSEEGETMTKEEMTNMMSIAMDVMKKDRKGAIFVLSEITAEEAGKQTGGEYAKAGMSLLGSSNGLPPHILVMTLCDAFNIEPDDLRVIKKLFSHQYGEGEHHPPTKK